MNGDRERLSRDNGVDHRRDLASPHSDGSQSSSSARKEASLITGCLLFN